MKNSEYWQERFIQLEEAKNKIGLDALDDIVSIYRQVQNELEGKIALWYQRLAANNGITLGEAKKLLANGVENNFSTTEKVKFSSIFNGILPSPPLKGNFWSNLSFDPKVPKDELKEFKWDVNDYIKYGKENALDSRWIKELENASAKWHISRFEALKIHTRQSLEDFFVKQNNLLTKTMGKVYRSGYYHTAFELQKGFNIGWDIASVDQGQIEKILVKPWAADGKNFSERIWRDKNRLIKEVHTELNKSVLLGQDPQRAINAIAKRMNVSKSNAGRLVMTESAYFSSLAQKDCFNDLGVEQYEIVATLDSHTSEICQSLDGKHFPMSDYNPGTTAPPFHPYCRSTTAPYFDVKNLP